MTNLHVGMLSSHLQTSRGSETLLTLHKLSSLRTAWLSDYTIIFKTQILEHRLFYVQGVGRGVLGS